MFRPIAGGTFSVPMGLLAVFLFLYFALSAPAAEVLSNGKISLSFETAPDLKLLSVQRGASTFTFHNQVMWRLLLRDSGGGMLYVDPSTYSHVFSYAVNTYPQYRELVADWDNVVVNATNSLPNVKVRAVLHDESSIADLSIEVSTALADYTLYNVWFPELYIDPIGADAADDFISLPKHGGYLLDDPVHRLNPTGYPNPGYWSMQFFSYYDDSGLLYLGTDDDQGFFKVYGMLGDGQHLYWRMENIPEDHTVSGVQYTMPYHFQIGAMEGDWYDAARRYRKWAESHLVTRKRIGDPATDFPEALREIEGIYVYHLGLDDEMNQTNFGLTPETLQGISDSKAYFGMSKAAGLFYQWTAEDGVDTPPWPEVTPLANMAPGIQQLKSNGDLVYLFTYSSMTCDPDLQSFQNGWVDYAIKDIDQNIILYGDAFKALMDVATPEWQVFTRDWCLDFTQLLDLDGMYFDVWSSVNFLDYDPTHGHPTGGGNYNFQGKKQQGQMARDAVRQLPGKSDWFLSSEFPQELLVDEMEMVLWNFDWWNATVGHAPSIRVPIFEYVYGDRQMVWTNRQSFYETTPSIWDNDLISYIQAAKLSLGQILGFDGFHDYPFGPGVFPSGADSFQFQKRLIQLQNIAKKYIMWGRIERAPEVTAVDSIEYEVLRKFPDPGVNMDIVPHFWIQTPSYPELSYVIPSVWRAFDDSIALVLINWWSTAQIIDYTFRFADYDLMPGVSYSLYELDETGLHFIDHVRNDFSRSDQLAGRSAKVLVLGPPRPASEPVRMPTPAREATDFQLK